jgi:MFS family permease
MQFSLMKRLSLEKQPQKERSTAMAERSRKIIANEAEAFPRASRREWIGRRRLLLFGAAVFGFASLLAAFSASAVMFIMARALLGIAAGTLAPSTLSLIRNMFQDPKQRTFAIGV